MTIKKPAFMITFELLDSEITNNWITYHKYHDTEKQAKEAMHKIKLAGRIKHNTRNIKISKC